ncbi:MAG: MFS transporter [Myxococcota bacterium]|nr:MFS transporter [Myxococcales bacterium]
MAAGALDTYQRRLFGLVSIATFFEGFDTLVTTTVLHQLGAELGVANEALFSMLSVINVGALLGFVPLALADRVGRRPTFLFALAGYTLACLATAATRTLGEFTACQVVARMFMVTELALAYVLLSEEMPAARRGRLNASMGAFASVGAIVPAALLSTSVELGFGWRGLYALGAAPIALLPLYVAWLREPPAFHRLEPRTPARALREAAALVAPARWRRAAAAALVWLSINFWNACAIFPFALYAQQERGFTPGDVSLWLTTGGVLQFAGYAMAGVAMDRFGRRRALACVLVLAAGASALAYLAHARALVVAGYLAMASLGGMWSIAQTITAELFPTELRATANGLASNVVGRLGMIAAPGLVGALGLRLGATGPAVALLGLAHLAVLPLLLRWLPETRGAALDAPVTAGRH